MLTLRGRLNITDTATCLSWARKEHHMTENVPEELCLTGSSRGHGDNAALGIRNDAFLPN
jgi:hypothetical protein